MEIARQRERERVLGRVYPQRAAGEPDPLNN